MKKKCRYDDGGSIWGGDSLSAMQGQGAGGEQDEGAIIMELARQAGQIPGAATTGQKKVNWKPLLQSMGIGAAMNAGGGGSAAGIIAPIMAMLAQLGKKGAAPTSARTPGFVPGGTP